MQVNGKWDKGICQQVFKGCLKSGGVKHRQKDASLYREKKEMEIYEQKANHVPAYRQQCRAVKPRLAFLPVNLFSWRYCQFQINGNTPFLKSQ